MLLLNNRNNYTYDCLWILQMWSLKTLKMAEKIFFPRMSMDDDLFLDPIKTEIVLPIETYTVN